MAQSDAERARAYRARKGATPRTEPKPCGTTAALRRHERNPARWGTVADCPPCRELRRQLNAEKQARHRARNQD